MYHIVYKTLNKNTGQFYIGKHSQTDEDFDGYLGSGLCLRAAVNKHGPENFIRETLYVFNDEHEAYAKEKEIVSEDLINDTLCYNLVPGGRGFATECNPKLNGNKGQDNPMYGRNHTEETKALQSKLKEGYKPWNTGIVEGEQKENWKKSISESLSGLEYDRYPCGKITGGTKWWNNGINHKRCVESPGSEWILGRINKGNLGGTRVSNK